MTAELHTDDHPEELIELAKLGALEPDEQSRLGRHLAICAACTAHLALIPELERQLAPQPRDEVLVGRALDAAMLRLQAPAAGRARPVSLDGAAWPRWLRLAAAGVLLASGVTAAATIAVRKMSPRPATDSPAPSRVDVDVPHAAPIPAPPPAEAPAPVAEPPASARPVPVSSARPPATAAMLFERAGKLRGEGHVDAAIGAYRRLQESFPKARESQLSFALAGQLLLDRGRPGDALAQFEHLAKNDGDVGEEALVGRATALEQLHRTADAKTAWRSLLDRYPRSVYAGRARARLGQLGDTQ